jgi:hypothetical protein
VRKAADYCVAALSFATGNICVYWSSAIKVSCIGAMPAHGKSNLSQSSRDFSISSASRQSGG